MYISFVGLEKYCRFGAWSKEENEQLKKNWKKATEVGDTFSTLVITYSLSEHVA